MFKFYAEKAQFLCIKHFILWDAEIQSSPHSGSDGTSNRSKA
jgi:hypothetical protein